MPYFAALTGFAVQTYFAALTGFAVLTYFAAHAENLHIRRLCNWGASAGHGVNLPMV